MRGNLVWDICAFVPSKAGLTKEVVCREVGLSRGTVKLVYSDTLVTLKMCCYNQVVVVTRTFSTESIESVPAMCAVVKRLML